MISPEVKESIQDSVLCWLATNSENGFPNVSPKEAFICYENSKILVANIASPTTQKNIGRDPRVCISFVNIFIQKGYKIKGQARLILRGDPAFEDLRSRLCDAIGGTFPVISVIEIEPTSIEEIIAPSYRLDPESDASDRIQESLETYRVSEYQKKMGS